MWAYVLTWAFAKQVWGYIFFDTLRLKADTVYWIFNGSYILLMVISIGLVLSHITIVAFPKLRRRIVPRWYSHFAAAAAGWLAVGSITLVIERPFPFDPN